MTSVCIAYIILTQFNNFNRVIEVFNLYTPLHYYSLGAIIIYTISIVCQLCVYDIMHHIHSLCRLPSEESHGFTPLTEYCHFDSTNTSSPNSYNKHIQDSAERQINTSRHTEQRWKHKIEFHEEVDADSDDRNDCGSSVDEYYEAASISSSISEAGLTYVK